MSAPVTHAARTQVPRLTSVAAKMSGALSKISKKYNKKEIFSLKAVFDEADADGSGEIDSSELRKALSKSSLSAAAVDMFKALDKDGSKRIGLDEYLKVRHDGRTVSRWPYCIRMAISRWHVIWLDGYLTMVLVTLTCRSNPNPQPLNPLTA